MTRPNRVGVHDVRQAQGNAAGQVSIEAQVCPSCGEENPARFRLCGFCGASLAKATPPQELRKTVTILFSDLKGSTSLGELIDPEALHEVKNRYFETMAAVLDHHGGKIEKYIGDAIMAVFGLPRVREDDALRAVRAALGMQKELARINVELERDYGVTLAARIGVNTGEVVATADASANQRLADGDAVNVAARLEQAAPPMEVLIGDITWQLVRDRVTVDAVEPLALKGKAELVPAYRLLSVLPAGTAPSAQRVAPLVGRDEELALLEAEFEAAASTDGVRLVTVVGDPGVGKSRLISEFVAAVEERAAIVRGRCLPYGDGITFWPVVEIVRGAAGISDDDPPELARAKLADLIPEGNDAEDITDRVASATGLTTTTYPVSELFWAIRKLLEQMASQRPLLVVVDDIHDAEPTFIELLDHVVDSGDAPILLVATARHELLEKQPEWGEGVGRQLVRLHPLSIADTQAMIDRLLGDAGIDPDVARRVSEVAEGNPLFVEQVISVLVDQGALRLEDGRWVSTRSLAGLAIPPTMHALIAARLDLLTHDERAVIEPASVIGLEFPQPAVEEILGDAGRTVPAQLAALDRKQFVHPATEEDQTHRFHHLLIRDGVYNRLLKRSRADLHEKFVTWAERVNQERDREVEFEEILGYHLEQAYRYRQDLGPVDADGRAVAQRAAEKLGSAGRRAFARGDMPAAANLLSRAAALLPTSAPLWRNIVPELAEALIENGDFEAADALVVQALQTGQDTGDERLAARAALERLALDIYRSEPNGDVAIRVARESMTVLERVRDDAGLARALRLAMLIHGTVGRFEEAEAAAEQFVRHVSGTGDTRLAARGAAGYATVALLGPTPVREVIAKCEQLMTEVAEDRKAVAIVSGVLAVLKAMEGSFDEARSLYQAGRRMLEELGRSVPAASTSTESSRVEMLAGDYVAAEQELRRDYEALGAMGEKYLRSTVAGNLSRALYGQGRLDEARAFAEITRDLAAPDDTASQVLWRGTQARIAASAGMADEAITLAEEALELVSETASPSLIADATSELGDVLATLGRRESAISRWAEALSVYERKGDRVSAGRMRDRLTRERTRSVDLDVSVLVNADGQDPGLREDHAVGLG
jgi:class 3 adenylate cyclase/tetratricopeptide (TPR) repeat protein